MYFYSIDSLEEVYPGESQKQILLYIHHEAIPGIFLQDVHVQIMLLRDCPGCMGMPPARTDSWAIYYVPVIQDFIPESRIPEYDFEYEIYYIRDFLSSDMQERLEKIVNP